MNPIGSVLLALSGIIFSSGSPVSQQDTLLGGEVFCFLGWQPARAAWHGNCGGRTKHNYNPIWQQLQGQE